jgi:Zn ribbon nucleic-acid-binding protein
MEAKVRRIEYKCNKCGEKDTLKLWPSERVPAAVNCWNCGSGREYPDVTQQIMNGAGMAEVKPAPLH